jgi:CelD/BcsL family acetyltransferase involved in cellulose biosynthesis
MAINDQLELTRPDEENKARLAPRADIWVDKPYVLKFYLGEFYLGAVHFRAKVLDVYAAGLSESEVAAQLPLEELHRGTEVLSLPSIRMEEKPRRITFRPDSIRYVPARYPRYYVETQGTLEDYLQKFSSKTRRELLRQVRKLEKDGGGKLDWREFRRPEDMAEYQRLAREVSKKTYQERLLKNGIPDTAEYVQELERLARLGVIRAYILFFGGAPIVFHLCSIKDVNLVGQQIGYDPAFRKYSPGTVEQFLLLEKLFNEKEFQRFDFGGGESSYKEFFATGKAPCADIYYYRRTLRNRVIVTLHSMLARFCSATTEVLARVKIKERLKKFLRLRFRADANPDAGPGAAPPR